jgi:2-dehydropantoate 2-reductase
MRQPVSVVPLCDRVGTAAVAPFRWLPAGRWRGVNRCGKICRVKIAVLGPGGIGGLLAALLARDGSELVCLAGEQTAAAIHADGITVRSDRYGTIHQPVDAATALDRPVDACLVTVKAGSFDAALDRVTPAALGGAIIVPFLNGIEHLAKLRRRYPPEQVIAATIRAEAARVGPGQIQHLGPYAGIDLALGPGSPPAGQQLADALGHAGLDVMVRTDENRILWDKLSFLAPFALVTTMYGVPVGVVRAEHNDELQAVITEVTSVAQATGAAVEPAPIRTAFANLPDGMKSSMLRDAEAGNPIEVDAIGGAIVRAADKRGIDVPATRRLVETLLRR